MIDDKLLVELIHGVFKGAPKQLMPIWELMLHLVEQGRYAELLELVEKMREAYGEADNK